MKIKLSNCEFFAYHGVLDFEKEQGQAFFVDVTLTLNKPEMIEDDRLENTVHYGEVYDIVKKTIENNRYDLIETLAHFIGKNICAEFSKVKHVSVSVRKPGAPVDGVFDHMEVTVDNENR